MRHTVAEGFRLILIIYAAPKHTSSIAFHAHWNVVAMLEIKPMASSSVAQSYSHQATTGMISGTRHNFIVLYALSKEEAMICATYLAVKRLHSSFPPLS